MTTIKAILIKTRKAVYIRLVGKTPKTRYYKDEHGRVFPEDALEFYEYYGG